MFRSQVPNMADRLSFAGIGDRSAVGVPLGIAIIGVVISIEEVRP